MTNAEVMARNAAHEVGVYARQPVALVRGRGAEVWDADGRRYIDFFAGLSVSNVGHCHPAVVEAVRAQTRPGNRACAGISTRPTCGDRTNRSIDSVGSRS